MAQVAPVETVPQADDRESQGVQETAVVTKTVEPPQPTATDVVTTSPPAPNTEQQVVAPEAAEPTPVEPQLAPTNASAAQPMPPSPTCNVPALITVLLA